MLRRRTARGQSSRQLIAEVTDTGKKQVAAGAPDQKPGEGERFGVSFDVAIGLRARQLAEYLAWWVAGSLDQHQQRQHHAKGDALEDAQRQLPGDHDRGEG